MLCERCHKNEAAVHTVQVINGEKTEHYYCEACAKETGIESPISFEDIFKGFLNSSTPKQGNISSQKAVLKCPQCQMTYDELRRNGKFGCSACYEAFSPYIESSLKGIHGYSTHKGKVPKRNGGMYVRKSEIAKLKNKLIEAISKEEYEEAGVLRDRIRALEGDEKHD